jgi:hypothetical protein
MHKISIDASPSQIRKLRKGLKVRVKKGTGFNIIVHPETYNRVSRAFGKNKGLELELSQEEIKHNENYEEGDDMRGLFGESSPQSGASMIPSPSEPSKMQEPQSRGSEGQGLFRKAKRSIKDNVHRAKLADSLNDHLQTNYDYMGRAGIDNAVKMAKQASMSRMGINARKALSARLDGNDSDDNEHAPPSRMYIKGGSLTEKGTVGLNGGMIHTFVPPALISQPFSANFQMQHFMPPQYQHYEQGGHDDSEDHGLGSGLYAGRGLGLGINGCNIKNDLRKYGRAHGNEAIDYAQGKIMRRIGGRNIKNDLRKFGRAHGNEAIDYAQGKIMKRI